MAVQQLINLQDYFKVCVDLWNSGFSFHIEIWERFQYLGAPWFLVNKVIQRDLQISTDKKEIINFSKSQEKLTQLEVCLNRRHQKL